MVRRGESIMTESVDIISFFIGLIILIGGIYLIGWRPAGWLNYMLLLIILNGVAIMNISIKGSVKTISKSNTKKHWHRFFRPPSFN